MPNDQVTKETWETAIDLVPYVGEIYKGLKVVLGFTNYLNEPDPLAWAVNFLQGEIVRINQDLQVLTSRVNEVSRRLAAVENNRRVNALTDCMRNMSSLGFRLSQKPTNADMRASIAFDAGLQADRFLDDPDLWLWTDLKTTFDYDDYGNVRNTAVDVMPGDFKSRVALPIYVVVMLTWLTAIDLDTGAGYDLVRSRYGAKLRRHIAKVSTRPDWKELQDQPDTFPENIKSRITCYPLAANQYADAAGVCKFSIVCANVMDRKTTVVVTDLDVQMPVLAGDPNPVLCTASPHLGLSEEQQIEDDQGVAALTALGELLDRIDKTGSLRGQFIGKFDSTPAYNIAFLYTVTPASDTLWYKQLPSTAPNAPAGWIGPRSVGSGWADLLAVVPAGGNRFYGVAADGTLYWYQHDGFNDGTRNWKGPVVVGSGWNGFSKIVAGSDGVLYAVKPDGTLLWYRHDGVQSGGGAGTWRGPAVIGTGWDKYKAIFSPGQGILYTVNADGVLMWNHHQGFANGDNAWDIPMHAGNGWQDFKDVFSAGEGIVYAVRPDGTLLWYKHEQWSTGPTLVTPAPGELFRTRVRNTWQGPITAGTGWTGYRHIFPMLPATPTPPA